MKEKQFINLFPIRYWHDRSKYNPLRYILGKKYLSKKIPHNLFDTSDIMITESSGDPVKDYLAKIIAVKHLNEEAQKYNK